MDRWFKDPLERAHGRPVQWILHRSATKYVCDYILALLINISIISMKPSMDFSG
jgi:hypothetical protein